MKIIFAVLEMPDRFAKNNQKKSMIFDPIGTRLFVFESTGACVDVDVSSAMPIQMALQSEGGIIKFHSVYMDTFKKEVSWINYHTLCMKVKLCLELTPAELKHNMEFFGGMDSFFDEPINFDLEGNKFKMP